MIILIIGCFVFIKDLFVVGGEVFIILFLENVIIECSNFIGSGFIFRVYKGEYKEGELIKYVVVIKEFVVFLMRKLYWKLDYELKVLIKFSYFNVF